MEQLKEKWFSNKIEPFDFNCPVCKQTSTKKVFNGIAKFVYCTNKLCNVNRYSDIGYFATVETNEKAQDMIIGDDDIQYVTQFGRIKQ